MTTPTKNTHKKPHFDSNSPVPFYLKRKTRIIAFFAFCLTACAFGVAAVAPSSTDNTDDLTVRQITEQLAIPSLEAQMRALEEGDEKYIREEKVARGDTLASLLQRLGVDDVPATNFIKSDVIARQVMQQKPGKTVRTQTNQDGELLWLRTTLPDHSDKVIVDGSDGNRRQVSNIVIERQKGTDLFKVTQTATALERRLEMHTGEISSSLFAATDAANIPDAIASQLVEMFSTDIDFSSDLRRGDHFQLLYETFWQNGEMVSTGRILAGEFSNAGKKYQSVWFDGNADGGSYYGFDGKSMKKAFLRSPIKFTRISGVFSMRFHPIFKQWKQHAGVDFAAPAGTPIMASADGVVDTAGQASGYGNMVVLKHWRGYSTAYAHMSRFAAGIHTGVKVRQGDVIGYVGSTGWATGPHLHYEFRINNQAQDPLKVKIEQVQVLNAADIQRFKSVVQDVQHRFALLRPDKPTQGLFPLQRA